MIARLAAFDLEYVEQPVRDARRPGRGAAARRRADRGRRVHPFARRRASRSARSTPPTSIVLKQQPLGGVRAALAVAEAAGRARGRELDDGDVGGHRRRASRSRPRCPSCRTRAVWRRSARSPGDVTHAPARARRRRAARCGRSCPTPTCWRATPRRGEQVSDALGLLEVARVARRRAITSTRASAMRSAMRSGDVDVLGVEPADDQRAPASAARRAAPSSTAARPARARASWYVSQPTVLSARRSSSPARSRGSEAKSGCASQRSRNASTPSRSISCASRSSASRRAARSAASAMPGDALDQHEPLHDARAGRARAAGTGARPASSRRRSAGRPRVERVRRPSTKSRPSADSRQRVSPVARGWRTRVPTTVAVCVNPCTSTHRHAPHGGILA